jgi:flagellar basal-body rod modification protein FlgD
MVEAIASINQLKSDQTPASATIQGKQQTIGETFDEFLLLLTTQLKNQDPTQPLDPNQFTQQLVSFAGVEQAVATNKKLDSLVNLTNQNGVSNAIALGTSFLGKEIEAAGDVGSLSKGGNVTYSYVLPEGATSSFITIRDSEGNPVLGVSGASTPGRHEFVWNGRNAGERQMPDGAYAISVGALDEKNSPLDVSTSVKGVVNGLIGGNGTAQVLVDNIAVPIDQIIAVRPAPEGAAATE